MPIQKRGHTGKYYALVPFSWLRGPYCTGVRPTLILSGVSPGLAPRALTRRPKRTASLGRSGSYEIHKKTAFGVIAENPLPSTICLASEGDGWPVRKWRVQIPPDAGLRQEPPVFPCPRKRSFTAQHSDPPMGSRRTIPCLEWCPSLFYGLGSLVQTVIRPCVSADN